MCFWPQQCVLCSSFWQAFCFASALPAASAQPRRVTVYLCRSTRASFATGSGPGTSISRPRLSGATPGLFAPSRAASAIGKGALPSELASLLPLRPPRSISSLRGGRRGAPSDSSPPLPHLGQPPNARRRDRDIGGRRAVDAGSCHGLPKQDREHHRVGLRRDGLRPVGEVVPTNRRLLRGAQEADDSW